MAAVQLIWSLTNGGSGLDEPLDHGDNSSVNILGPTTIYLHHTGTNPITNCGFYLAEFSGTYSGDATATDDYNELISWGDAVTASGFGGFQINQNAVNSFPAASWPTFTHKTTTDGFGTTFRTGVGNTLVTASGLRKETYSAIGVNGEVPTGVSPNVRFQTRVVVPSNETVPGVRQFESVLRFTFTS